MTDNTHTQLAQLRAAGVHEWQAYEGSTDATNIAAILDAQVEATLALAYEQRTANLIAIRNGTYPSLSGEDYAKLSTAILERIGL